MLRAVQADALQVVEWGQCSLVDVRAGGLAGNEMCAQSACIVGGYGRVDARNCSLEFTGVAGGAAVAPLLPRLACLEHA